ncbi:MAG: aldehyde dehydrogenase family protein [Alphaproteobacteria bacterium]|uniref:Aldehyde dehydrogenase family protein n=1 Tax=Candidatus Nitrobium versatile TaxID=2884831 RepID=A0A953JDQ2_9BACT|nr:aldehyde dehydrogenase family protein [Candidatus Nitrobium versatile]
MEKRWKILLGGREVETKDTLNVVNPYNNDVVFEVCRAGEEEAERAIEAAHAARETIAGLPSYKKAEILTGVAEALLKRREEVARTITLESGKPLRDARGEVDRSVLTFRVASEEASRIGGEVIPLDRNAFSEGRWGFTRRFPAGPVIGITPFNFPLNLVSHKVAPAIASGNPIIIKPAAQTPATALLLGEIVSGAGLPEGGISVIPCEVNIAEKFILDERIKVLSFTGSAPVGWMLKSKAPQKKALLELGGNAGVLVDESADLEYAVKRCVTGAFSYAGQVCISVQRIYIHERVYDAFVEKFLSLVRTLKSGNPLEEDTDLGPMIDEKNAVRADTWIGEAKETGAKVLTGGRREGNFYLPTVLADTTPEMKVSCMEVFAPIVTVVRIRDFEEGLHAVNSTIYGLQAGVFTRDLKHAFSAFERLEVGGVIVNDIPTYRVDHMPYGGVKQSGFGREGVKYAIEEMTELRLMVLNGKL